MKIIIKFPTRERPERFFKLLDNHYQLLNKDFHFIISLDRDDPFLNCYLDKLKPYENLSYFVDKSNNKVHAINRDIDKYHDWDIIIVVADDMVPLKKGYDDIIRNHMSEYFPDLDGVLFYNDGYKNEMLNSIPIMGKNYFKRFGWVYNPVYKSFYCDDEFMEIAYLLERQIYIDGIIIRHDHPSLTKTLIKDYDKLYKKNDKCWRRDEKLYKKRKSKNYFMNGNRQFKNDNILTSIVNYHRLRRWLV